MKTKRYDNTRRSTAKGKSMMDRRTARRTKCAAKAAFINAR